MPTLNITPDSYRALLGASRNPLPHTIRNDGTVDIELEQDTLDRLHKHRQRNETISDTIRRICWAGGWAHLKKTPLGPPTLIDSAYRASFSNTPILGWRNNYTWRQAFTTARRFMVDDEMSTFMGELATQAFVRPGLKSKTASRMVDQLRMGARLPHEVTWVEYNLRNAMKRSHELLDAPFDPNEAPQREGWLLQQHPTIPTAFRAHIISDDNQNPDRYGFDTWTFPVAFGWTVDEETVLPWRPLPFGEEGATASEVVTGVSGYKTGRASVIFSDMVETPNNPQAISGLLGEWAGCLRRMWALLATINDLPTLVTEVRTSKGFMAPRHGFKKYLAHRTITLTVPQNKYRKVIREALALAHRRAHGVRGHWRDDWRHRLSPLCEPHEFTADEKHMTCVRCKGRKSWVTPHQRGDDRVGLILHDYKVEHEK